MTQWKNEDGSDLSEEELWEVFFHFLQKVADTHHLGWWVMVEATARDLGEVLV